MSEKDYALIERYLRQQLSEQEQREFEAQLAVDKALQEEVILHEKALAALNFRGLSDLKQKLQQREVIHTLAKQKRQQRLWVGLLFLLSLVLMLIYWLWVKTGSPAELDSAVPQAPRVRPQNKPEQSIPPDTSPVIQPPTPAQAPIAQRRINTQELFAEAFQPYSDASLNPNVRDDQNLSPFEQFLQFYWNQQYQLALQSFEKLDQVLQTNDDVLFLKANALLATGQIDAAQSIFRAMITRNESRFCPAAEWYLALCLVKKEELLLAKKQLQGISSKTDHPYQKAAVDLLEQLHRSSNW
jgi:tetratricopeptide (TPR) repeat protein